MNRILKFSVTARVSPIRKLCKMTPNSRMAMPTSWAEARAGVVVVWCEACSRSSVCVEIDFSCSRSVTVSWSLEVPSAVWGSDGSRQRGGCAWVDGLKADYSRIPRRIPKIILFVIIIIYNNTYTYSFSFVSN